VRVVVAKRRGLRARVALWLGFFWLLAAVVLVIVLEGRRREALRGEATTTGAELGRGSDAALTGAAGPACDGHASCAKGALCTRGRCEPITATTPECRDAIVRFARGTSEISSTAEAAIEGAARCFDADREPTVAVEPSRDPSRSARENDELTEARVVAVRRALEQRGVAPERLSPSLPPDTRR
jgi:outer membrane protein OmpA-like peptidoglycan-associated protein